MKKQEAFMMKRFLGLILALCLILGIAAEAAAAGKPVFSQQPKSATTDRKGTVSFSVKVKANGSKVSYTWYFVNPATGEKVSGKNLSKTVKGVKVAKPNTPKITLKKVPAEMHGWLVYCHINGNGYKQDSDQVVLNVYGMEPVSDPSAQPEGSGEPAAEPEQPAEGAETAEPAEGGETAEPAPEGGETAEPAEGGEAAEPAEGGETAEAAPEGGEVAEPAAADDPESEGAGYVSRDITVSASAAFLIPIDSMGKATSDAPVSSLTFTDTGNVSIRSEEPIKSWTINGIRFESENPQNTINLFNISEDLTISLSTEQKTAASAQVDESVICKVTCEGCAFTCATKGIRNATEGEVPSGSLITVFAKDSSALPNGYVINGAEAAYMNKASFQLTVTEDTNITLK